MTIGAYQSLRSFIDTELERRKWESEQHQKTYALWQGVCVGMLTMFLAVCVAVKWTDV